MDWSNLPLILVLRFFDFFVRLVPESEFWYVLTVVFPSECLLLICGVITLLSRFCFEKTFNHPFWKYILIVMVCGYVLIGVANGIPLTRDVFYANGGDFFIEMDAAMGYWILALFGTFFLSVFTVIYTLLFLYRLIGKLVKKGKKRGGDDAWSPSN